ncbi:4,5-DOPA dioxygenase extradiol 1-like [Actinidia eriantha]|uniref:4,5-DOPA dioxygenase extradiol 1-like n=1 Tax=Actinidia eriantha TaxID=165200 RepID=UPI00258D1AE5|nr:4,5-DOPA dioxygenase extradiol 1-like [Actinidia eriantha]
MEMPITMDAFFIPHAMSRDSPESTPTRPFFRKWKEEVVVGLPKPKAILLVSAHWVTSDPTVNVVHHNQTIYDFVDFPPFMSEIKYPAPGAPLLAMRVKELLMESGFETVHEDRTRGLDHGTWFPLMLMYPEADVPVCQLSVQSSKDGAHHYNMGKALASLRAEGVLIIGSGGATNYAPSNYLPDDGPVLPSALEFDTWLKDALLSGRHRDVICYEKVAPHAKIAHPEAEHFYPLLVALGSAGEAAKAELIHHSWGASCLSMASYRFSNNP